MYRFSRLLRTVNKIFPGPKAVADFFDGATVAIGGFGLCGVPHATIKLLQEQGSKNLTVYNSCACVDDWGIGLLIQAGHVKRMVCSYMGGNNLLENLYLNGDIEIEFCPQGTLVEAMRAGGAGIPAFYTPTGYGTVVQEGGFPIRLNKDGTVAIPTEPRETRCFNGRWHILERGIHTDFSLIKAWKSDRRGNIVFRGTARNFNPVVATCGKICIAEVEEIVEDGTLDPNQIHLPGVYVHRIYKPEPYEKRIEFLTSSSLTNPSKDGSSSPEKMDIRERIARRAALEFKDGMYVNLGIGVPTMAANYTLKGMSIELQSENGLLGIGPFPPVDKVDPDYVNASKQTISLLPTSSIFSSDQSFAMIRGGHIDMTMLGALQVAPNGDLSNWIVPKKLVRGMGGAMDLVSSGVRVIIVMEHTSKGAHKIVERCTLPITGKGVVDRVITELCVFDIDKQRGVLKLVELTPGVSVEDVKKATGCSFIVDKEIKQMRYAGVE